MKRIVIILFIINFGCEEETRLIETMEYKQSGCYGSCPIFEVTISANRIIRYIGNEYVLIKDTIYDYVSTEQLMKLTDAFNDCNYSSLNDEYSNNRATDMASAYTSMQIGGKLKSVYHYFGDFSAPEELKTLYLKINEILNTEKWTGKSPSMIIQK